MWWTITSIALIFIGGTGLYALGEWLKRDRDRWRRTAEEWRKRATYMVENKVPGETREETCIRLTQDALWQQPEDWKYAEAIQAKDATGGDV